MTPGGVLWYAVNPSYNWGYAFIDNCKGGNQIVVSTDSTVIRIWRVLYNAEDACAFNPGTSRSSCYSDVAKGFALNDTMDLMSVVNDGRLCNSPRKFDLWVESLEYFDELNVAVSVRRGSLNELRILYFPETITTEEPNQGYTVTYFISTQNTSMIREGSPWLPENIYPKVLVGTAVLCPALNVLPEIGTFVGESFAAGGLLVKMVMNLLFNPFAISELLVSRGVACPDNTLLHSALDNCGQALYSLDAFYDSVDNANAAFWGVFTFLVDLLVSKVPANAANIVSPLLYGAVKYGESTTAVSLAPVVYKAQVFNMAGLGSMLGGRRLLQKGAAAAGGKGGGGGGGGGGFISGIFNTITGVVTNIFSMVGDVGNIAMMEVSRGANMGILIAAHDPTYMMGHWVSAPSIAWSRFSYGVVTDVVLNLGADLYQHKTVQWADLLNAIYEGRAAYDDIVVPAIRNGCGGLRIMMGVNSGLAQGFYYNCLSGADMMDAWYGLVQVFTVDVELFKCTCVSAIGQDFLRLK